MKNTLLEEVAKWFLWIQWGANDSNQTAEKLKLQFSQLWSIAGPLKSWKPLKIKAYQSVIIIERVLRDVFVWVQLTNQVRLVTSHEKDQQHDTHKYQDFAWSKGALPTAPLAGCDQSESLRLCVHGGDDMWWMIEMVPA